MERRFQSRVSGNCTFTSPIFTKVVAGAGGVKCEDSRDGDAKGSLSSRTVGDIAWAIFLRDVEILEDIRFIMRLARLAFLSFSSDVEDDEGVGDIVVSRLEVDRRLLIDMALLRPGLPLAWVDGGRAGERRDGVAGGCSIVRDRRRSDIDARP